VPTLLIVAEWDQDTPLFMAQEVFAKLVNAPLKRHGVIGEGTHTVAIEKNFLPAAPYALCCMHDTQKKPGCRAITLESHCVMHSGPVPELSIAL
jgi:hypothetical protein